METSSRSKSTLPNEDLTSVASLFESLQITPRPSYNAVLPPKALSASSSEARRGYNPRPKYQIIDSGLEGPYLPYDIDGASPEEQEQLQADLKIGR